MVTLYNVISHDWFITDKDGSEDFIPDELWPQTLEIYRQFDVLAMGRKTYETIQAYPSALTQSFEKLSGRKVVVTHDPHLEVREGYQVVTSLEAVLEASSNVLVSSGPTLNNYLLEHALVDTIIFHQLPINIDIGTEVFAPGYRNLLTLVSETDEGIAKKLLYHLG